MWGKTYQCQIFNAGELFIGVRFSKFHDFWWFFKVPWLFQKILFFHVFQAFQTLREPCIYWLIDLLRKGEGGKGRKIFCFCKMMIHLRICLIHLPISFAVVSCSWPSVKEVTPIMICVNVATAHKNANTYSAHNYWNTLYLKNLKALTVLLDYLSHLMGCHVVSTSIICPFVSTQAVWQVPDIDWIWCINPKHRPWLGWINDGL